jgi:hypothetical protein
MGSFIVAHFLCPHAPLTAFFTPLSRPYQALEIMA